MNIRALITACVALVAAPAVLGSDYDAFVDRVNERAAQIRVDSFAIAWSGQLVVDDGLLVGVGESRGWVLGEGDTVTPGTYWAPIGGSLLDVATGQLADFGPTVIGVPNEDEFDPIKNIGVRCRKGYFACCGHDVNDRAVAKCYKNSQVIPSTTPYHPTHCAAGGHGATECQVPIKWFAQHDMEPTDDATTVRQIGADARDAARLMGRDEFEVVLADNRVVDSGELVGVGDNAGITLSGGDALRPGGWTSPNGFVSFDIATGNRVFYEPNAYAIVPMDGPTAGKEWGVTCGEGYYACCGYTRKKRTAAKCYRDDDHPDPDNDPTDPSFCQAGGPGAESCFIPDHPLTQGADLDQNLVGFDAVAP